MCWITDKLPELKIAEKDIATLKVILKKNSILIPYFQYNNLCYKLNKLSPLVILEIETLVNYKRYIIEAGYHSHSESCSYEISSDYIEINNDIYRGYGRDSISCCLVSCIIPKGTKYCVNEHNEYVSEQIIIKNIIGETT